MAEKNLKELSVGEELVFIREIDRYRPIIYAGASGDFNPIHIDPSVAQAVGFKNIILHGMCTLAFYVEGLIEASGGNPAALKSISVRFSRPVNIEDTITFTSRVVERNESVIRLEGEAKNQDGEFVLKQVEAEIELLEV